MYRLLIIKILFFLLLFFFTSCIEVRFESAMPKDQLELTKFPEELMGVYKIEPYPLSGKTKEFIAKQELKVDSTQSKMNIDTLIIKCQSFRFPFAKNEFLLTDSNVVIKRYNDTCFIFSKKNIQNGLVSWTLFPFSYKNDKITVYSCFFTSKFEYERMIDSIEQITYVERIYNRCTNKKTKKRNNYKEIDYCLINPTINEFEKMIDNDIFHKWIEFNRIK